MYVLSTKDVFTTQILQTSIFSKLCILYLTEIFNGLKPEIFIKPGKNNAINTERNINHLSTADPALPPWQKFSAVFHTGFC